jgi:hypothetical protein
MERSLQTTLLSIGLARACGVPYCYPLQPGYLPFDDGGGGNNSPSYIAIANTVNPSAEGNGVSNCVPLVISSLGKSTADDWLINTSLISQAALGAVSTPAVRLSVVSAPILTASSGESLRAATYYVRLTYINVTGESLGSIESSLVVGANKVLVVVSPPDLATAAGYNVHGGSSLIRKLVKTACLLPSARIGQSRLAV